MLVLYIIIGANASLLATGLLIARKKKLDEKAEKDRERAIMNYIATHQPKSMYTPDWLIAKLEKDFNNPNINWENAF